MKNRLTLLALAALLLGGCHGQFGWSDPADRGYGDRGEAVLSFVWKRVLNDHSLDSHPQEFAGVASSQRALYVGSHNGVLYAIDPKSGQPLWRTRTGPISSSPVVDRGRIFVGTDTGAMLALNTFDGSVKWKYQTKGAIVRAPVLAGDSIVFSNSSDRVFALDRDTGKWRWQYERDTPDEFTIRGHAGVAVDGDRVFCGFADGHVVGLSLSVGEVLWIRSLAGSEERFVDVDSTPAIADGVLYASSTSGGLFALNIDDGAEKWHLSVKGAGPVIVDDDRVFFAAADEGLFSLDTAGNVIWRQGMFKAGDPARPVVRDGYLFLNVSERGLFVVEKRTGRLLQHFDPGSGISSSPSVHDGSVYLFSNGGILYRMSINDA